MIKTNKSQKPFHIIDSSIEKIRTVSVVRLAFAIAVMSITASICSASAANVYIAQNASGGSNGADCAGALPVTWFNSAANWGSGTSQIGPGTTVHLCGTFTGTAGGQMLVVAGDGASGSPVLILFESGANLTSPAWSSVGAIEIYGHKYITVDGGTNGIIQNTANGSGLANAQNSKGVFIAGSSNIIVKNLLIANMCQHTSTADATGCNTSGTDDAALKIDDNGSNSSFITFTNNTIHDTNTGISALFNSGDSNFVFTNNTISRTNWGLNLGASPGSVGNILVANNAITCVVGGECNWDAPGACLGGCFHHNGMIIDPGDGVTMTGLVISNNYIHDENPCTGGIFLDPSGSGNTPGVQIYNNVFYTSPGQFGPANAWITVGIGITAAVVVNNTVVGPGNQGLSGQLGPTYMNNIVASISNGVSLNGGYTGVASDYNDFYNVTSMYAGSTYFGSVAAWSAGTGLDTHSVTSNPNLTANFMLNAGSPAIGKGTNLWNLGIVGLRTGAPQSFGAGGSCGTGCVPRPSSGAWDMGAFPHQGTSAQGPNPPSGVAAAAH